MHTIHLAVSLLFMSTGCEFEDSVAMRIWHEIAHSYRISSELASRPVEEMAVTTPPQDTHRIALSRRSNQPMSNQQSLFIPENVQSVEITTPSGGIVIKTDEWHFLWSLNNEPTLLDFYRPILSHENRAMNVLLNEEISERHAAAIMEQALGDMASMTDEELFRAQLDPLPLLKDVAAAPIVDQVAAALIAGCRVSYGESGPAHPAKWFPRDSGRVYISLGPARSWRRGSPNAQLRCHVHAFDENGRLEWMGMFVYHRYVDDFDFVYEQVQRLTIDPKHVNE